MYVSILILEYSSEVIFDAVQFTANFNDASVDEVRGKSEARKEAGLNALPLRTGTFDKVIRYDSELKAHLVDGINKI